MAQASGINLISTTIEHNPQLAMASNVLQKSSYGGLIVLILSGILVGALYGFLTIQRDALVKQKNTVSAQIAAQSTKEGLLAVVKSRAVLVKKVLATQKKLAPLFALAGQFTTPQELASLTWDETGASAVSVNLSTLTQAAQLVDAVVALDSAKKMDKPHLRSFTLGKDGTIQISLTFLPTL